MNIINEHWRNASESVEVTENNMATFIKDGEAIIFGSIFELANYQLNAVDTIRVYCEEEDLMGIYENFENVPTLHNSCKDDGCLGRNYSK